MDCRQAYDYIIRYFDNKLIHFEHLDLKQHLKLCKKCRCSFKEMEKVLNFVKNNVFEPPEDFESKVMAKICSIKSESKKRSNIIALLFGCTIYICFLRCL